MDATIYKPEIAFRIKAKNVVQVTAETVKNPATYSLTVKPIDVTELGASPIQVAIGDYLMDFVGTPYRITNVALPKITVSDDFRSGACPTSGQTAIVYRSVGDGNSPYLSPIYYRFLDKQALANSKRFELDILWKKLYSEVYVLDPLKWLKNSFSNAIEFGQALGLDHSINGEQSTALGIGNQTQSFRETILGSYAKDTTPISPTAWKILDLLFTVGNGLDKDNRSNALEVFKSGLVRLYNGLLIGKYEHGVVVPINGMLQYTAEDGLQQWKDGVWADLLIDAPSDGKPYGRENGLWIPIARAPDSGERKTGIDPGYFGQQSITDDYLYTCVQGGLAGEAIWKKSILMHT